MSIITRFIIGSDRDIKTLSSIGARVAEEKYGTNVPGDQLGAHINDHFNEKALRAETSNLSNQFLVVYEDGEPAGYARITSKGPRPEAFQGRSVVRIADFGVLRRFTDPEIKKQLFEKCLSSCGTPQLIWIAEFAQNPDLPFFETYGFKKTPEITGSHEFDLNAVYLVKEKANLPSLPQID